jgi:hypothetical protein
MLVSIENVPLTVPGPAAPSVDAGEAFGSNVRLTSYVSIAASAAPLVLMAAAAPNVAIMILASAFFISDLLESYVPK